MTDQESKLLAQLIEVQKEMVRRQEESKVDFVMVVFLIVMALVPLVLCGLVAR